MKRYYVEYQYNNSFHRSAVLSEKELKDAVNTHPERWEQGLRRAFELVPVSVIRVHTVTINRTTS